VLPSPVRSPAGPDIVTTPGRERHIEIAVILVLVLLNGLLAGSELAVLSVRRSRIRELLEEGSGAAAALEALRADPEVFLATVQVGITFIGAAAGAFGGTAFAGDLVPVIARVEFLAPHAEAIAFVLVVGFIAYLSVVLGELVPKSLALRSSESYALLAARPLFILSRLARPVVRLLTISSNMVLRVFGDRTSFTEVRVSPEEIQHLLEEAAESGGMDPTAGEIARRALVLETLTAVDLMVHRRQTQTVPSDATLADARRTLAESGHDWMPVVGPEGEDYLGYVTWRDLAVVPGQDGAKPVQAALRPSYFVPESMPALDILRGLRERRTRFAVVVSEYGSAVGIVTLQDLLEELVGEMLQENETPREAALVRRPDGTAGVDGLMRIRDLNEQLELSLPEDRGVTTVGALCAVLAGGRVPAAGETFTAPDGTVLVPAEVSPRRVRRVDVRPAPRELPFDPVE
jgi:putative hemolysin